MVHTQSKRAEMGVGTLIIFIALLLVAAVAAGVLIQTSGSLQQQALSTGTQATGQISTNAAVVEVSAENGTDGSFEQFFVVMRLAPGSDAIRLTDVTYTVSTVNTSQNLQYTDNVSNANQTHFGVRYLQQGDNHQEGVLVRGDVIEITFNSSRLISESETVRLNFIPRIGTATLTQFAVPDVVSTQRVYLYP
ncbi:MAG: archaellin/type IV pilin N-terminal domain-containing protein [Candidatus Woesearchaeota archaeon]